MKKLLEGSIEYEREKYLYEILIKVILINFLFNLYI